MKAWLILQLVLLVMLLAGPSEEFFFEYSKKALQEFFQSLKAKKPPPKSNIQHYHVHYYPIPYSMLVWPKIPVKRDLDRLYDDTSFAWSDYSKYLPNPSTIISDLQQLLDADTPTSDDTQASIDRNGQGLLLQVPVNQQFMVHLLRRSQQRQLAKAMT
ncbi:uncharacterized protein LOC126855890 [Cataglyphis hispanica]|uniref:uncharacterized protein LOC126855890 n=1 Tax=Cataglyphis hispanica TaxID=1086592 RepID=UPI00218090B9|nr:uncharacterized protein LOC126855890 [Cataglyphis hispanica]